MSTTTVLHTGRLPAGRLRQRALVKVELCTPAFDSASVVLSGVAEVHVGPDGSSPLPLTPNSELNPTDTWYEVTDPDGTVWAIVVPVGGPVQLEACLVDNPTSPGHVVGGVQTVTGTAVDNTDPLNPVINGGGGPGAVTSVFGRVGAVVKQAGDYVAGDVTFTPGGTIAANTVQAAVAEVATDAAAALATETARATGVEALKADLVAGLVPTSQIPALALTATFVVASQAAMLALTAAQVQPGDLAVRTDGAGTFVLTAADPSVLANWTRLNAPTDVVSSVNGQTGVVVLSAANVGAATAADIAAAITALGLGTAATKDTGTTSGKVPLLGGSNTLAPALLGTGVPDGTKFLRDDGTFVTPAGGGGSTLTPTAVKTANYTASAGDFVPADTSAGGLTVTLPNAPADKAQVAVKHVIQGGSNAVTIACAGTDVFNKAGGATSGTLSLLNQGTLLQYKASTGIWYVVGPDLALSTLDARYAAGPPLQLIETGASVYHLYDNGPITTAALTVGKADTTVFPVDRACTVIGLAARVSSAAGAGGIIRLGLWADNGKGKPGVLLLDSLTSLVSTATGLVEATFSQALTPGMYHVGWVAQVAVCSMQVSVGTTMGSKITTNPANLLQFGHIGYEQNGVTGALPNPFVPVTNDGNSSSPNVPRIAVRIA